MDQPISTSKLQFIQSIPSQVSAFASGVMQGLMGVNGGNSVEKGDESKIVESPLEEQLDVSGTHFYFQLRLLKVNISSD